MVSPPIELLIPLNYKLSMKYVQRMQHSLRHSMLSITQISQKMTYTSKYSACSKYCNMYKDDLQFYFTYLPRLHFSTENTIP